MPQVEFFRSRRSGPEIHLEDALIRGLLELFPIPDERRWIGGSLPIGSGIPDLVIVAWKPKVLALAHVEMSVAEILAYLRTVGRARIDTISERLRKPECVLNCSLSGLAEHKVIVSESRLYSLAPEWKEILPEIISVEVKVKEWRRAVVQASRNTIFSHKSYVALPADVAERVRGEPEFSDQGIGLLSVDPNGGLEVIRKSRRRVPRVWAYYYRLAEVIADYIKDDERCHTSSH